MPYEETPVGQVQALYRYPVKSTAGQAVRASAVTGTGMQHDRRWAVYTDDGGIASGKRTRRFRPVPGLLQWSSVIEDNNILEGNNFLDGNGGVPLLLSPEGLSYRADDPAAAQALSTAFGRELTLRPETETGVGHHDETPLHLVTTSSLAALEGLAGGAVDDRRFRANIVIDTGSRPAFCEDEWIGAELVLGDVVLRLGEGMPRCVMIDQAQAGVPAGTKALKLLGAHHSTEFGLQAHVMRTGKLRVGDVVTLRRSRTA